MDLHLRLLQLILVHLLEVHDLIFESFAHLLELLLLPGVVLLQFVLEEVLVELCIFQSFRLAQLQLLNLSLVCLLQFIAVLF